MANIADRIYKQFGPDKDTALEFFAVFSRFECALKCQDCQKKAKVKDGDYAVPYWEKYAEYLDTKSELCDKIKDAAEDLLKEPPRQQIVGEDGWKMPHDSEKGVFNIFRKVKRVRNNLFHGGKYASGNGWYDKDRDQKLVETSLKILYKCLEDKNPVTKAFFDELDLGEYGEKA